MLFAALVVSAPAFSQDLKTVKSPDGQIEFRIFEGEQKDTTLYRLGYQVFYRGKQLLDTSFLGFDIWEQEPLLGENVGMTESSAEPHGEYNAFVGKYMQNGSLGRSFNVEVRVYNSGIAFRYHLLRSSPLAELFITEEITELAVGVPVPATASLPFQIEQPGVGWIEVAEIPLEGYPRMSLGQSTSTVLVSRLSANPNRAHYVFAGKTPWTGPWRIIGIGPSRTAASTESIRAQLAR